LHDILDHWQYKYLVNKTKYFAFNNPTNSSVAVIENEVCFVNIPKIPIENSINKKIEYI